MKNNETNIFIFYKYFIFLTKYVYICHTYFFDQLKINLKIARGKS